VRDTITADWAFSIQSTIENIVREHFPSQLRQWPLLQSFNFEAYQVGSDHFVIALRDKLSGIAAGPGEPSPFPYTDHPPAPRTVEDVERWLSYLIDRFSLRHEDMAMVLPIHDSGQSDASADYKMFTDVEKELWNYQLAFWVTKQHSTLGTPVEATPDQPTQITYNLSGTNVRMNINSLDSSVNIVDQAPLELFQQLLAAVQNSTADPELVAKMTAAIEDMERDYGTERFLERYTSFVAILADHMQVFGVAVAPYLPALTQLLSPR
jgi:hypothetical protein